MQSAPALSGDPIPWTNQGDVIVGNGQPYGFTQNLGSGAVEPPLRFYRVLAQ